MKSSKYESTKCFFLLVGINAAMLATGCASVCCGRYQSIPVASEPPRAKIFVDNQKIGTTPTSVDLPRGRKNLVLKFEKRGHQPNEVALKRSLDAFFLGNIVAGGLIGLVWDFGTGAAYTLSPSEVTASLTKLSSQESMDFGENQSGVNPGKVIRIDDGQFFEDAPDVDLDLYGRVKRLLEPLGLNVVESDADSFDVTLEIKISGRALAGGYDVAIYDTNGKFVDSKYSGPVYTGAKVEGRMVLSEKLSSQVLDSKNFKVTISPPKEIFGNYPIERPFESALVEANFSELIVEMAKSYLLKLSP